MNQYKGYRTREGNKVEYWGKKGRRWPLLRDFHERLMTLNMISDEKCCQGTYVEWRIYGPGYYF